MTDNHLRRLCAGGPHAPAPAATARRWGVRVGLAVVALLAASQSGLTTARASFSGFRYTHTQSIDANVFGKCAISLHKEREAWVAADGSGLERRVEGDRPEYLSEDDRARCASDPPKLEGLGVASEARYGPGCLSVSGTSVDLSKLPTEPNQLRKLLETGTVEGGPTGPREAFIQIADLLRNTDASPELRSALYRAASGLSGVESLGETTDPAGRRGTGLAMVYQYQRHELIFDPETSALIAERDTVADNSVWDGPIGALIDEAVYSPSTIVDALPSDSSRAKMTLCAPEAVSQSAVAARRAHPPHKAVRSRKARKSHRARRSHRRGRTHTHGRSHAAGHTKA